MLLHYQLKKLKEQAKEAEQVDVVEIPKVEEETKKPAPKKKTNTKK